MLLREGNKVRVSSDKKEVTESYTSFPRWRNDIARSYNNLHWRVAKRGDRHPDWIWNDDLWGYYDVWDSDKKENNHYTFAVSESPNGEDVAVHVWLGEKIPLKSLADGIVPKKNIMTVIEKAKGKVPDDVYKELEKTFSGYRFK